MFTPLRYSSLLGPNTVFSTLFSRPYIQHRVLFFKCNLSIQMVFVSRFPTVSRSLSFVTTGQRYVTVNSQTSSILQ
jgi:hypothetical protein